MHPFPSGLFNDGVSNSRQDSVDCVLERMWKEVVVAMGSVSIFPRVGSARKLAHKLTFKPFKDSFTDRPRVFRTE
jgi:hypothetical protein